MKRSRIDFHRKSSWLVVLFSALLILMTSGMLWAQTTTIGGNLWQGAQLSNGSPQLTGNAPVSGASVMIQDVNADGAFVAYGSVVGSSWTASVPSPGEYLAMFSAPGHDLTSRTYRVGLGEVLFQDAYLPSLPVPTANLLVYTFLDLLVNGGDDFPSDPPLAGVTINLIDQDGTVVATGISGSSPTLPPVPGAVAGLYYFTGLEPGSYTVEADPTTVPGWDGGWYHTTTEEGSRIWEVDLYPGDPGVEDGGYMLWFGFLNQKGQLTDTTHTGRITGILRDAEGLDPTVPDIPEPGEPPEVFPPELECVVATTLRVPNGFAVLSTPGGTALATTEADPADGSYAFDNVPPGQYEVQAVDIPLNYIWKTHEVTVPVGAGTISGQDILVPRFFSRVKGHVYDGSTIPPTPLAGATVKFRLEPHNLWFETTTNANGWYKFDTLPEVETLGYVEVVPPAGFRRMNQGVLDPNSFDLCIAHQERRGNKYVEFFAGLDYRANLFVEPIPLGEGELEGFTFYDQLAPDLAGNWSADGLYDEIREPRVKGVEVQLWNADETTLIASTTSAVFDAAALMAQGWVPPFSTGPPPELLFGNVYHGPILGHFEFNGLTPGDYRLLVVPPLGYAATTPVSLPVTVAGGSRSEVNFGLTTQAPLAGFIEGAVFDDFNLVPNPDNPLVMEKAVIVGAPVGVYDHLGYLLDSWLQSSPLCYERPFPGPNCDRPELGPGPAMEKLVAPGPRSYLGNDPASPAYNSYYLPMPMTYNVGQGLAKYEADWSLVPASLFNQVTVLSPNGGELLTAGRSYHLQWDAMANTVHFKLYYSVDSGTTWLPIDLNLGNQRAYSWTLPDEDSVNCLFKVVAFDFAWTELGADQSDAPFTIEPARLEVISPSGPLTLAVGASQMLQWHPLTGAASYDLSYSTDGGTSWIPIDQVVAAISYNWTVPAEESADCLFRVEAFDASLPQLSIGSAVSATPFTITATPVALISPNGPLSLAGGEMPNVQWSGPTNAQIYELSYSTDGGLNWTFVDQVVAMTSYNWLVPNENSTDSLFKVEALDAAMETIGSAVSATPFTMTPAVALVSPTGPLSLLIGRTHNVQWDSSVFAESFDLSYSTDGGATWIPLAQSVGGNSFNWTVPDITSSDCLFRIVAFNASAVSLGFSDSAAPFSIAPVVVLVSPTGPLDLVSGRLHNVEWNAAAAAVNFDLSYSTDGGLSWISVAPGVGGTSYSWTVPVANSTDCRFRVEAFDISSGLLGSDMSAAPFVITPPATGDLNGDTLINLQDALRSLQIAIGIFSPTADELLRGDVAPLVNGVPEPDGQIVLSDALIILRKALGLLSF